MAIQQCLVIIKPDGLVKSLTGNILTALSETKLIIVGAKVMKVSKELAEEHYKNLKEKKPNVFEQAVKYLMGEFHTKRVLALVYHGENAIEKIRKICGSTNPEEASPDSIRGRYGRINSKTGVYENVIHASESEKDAEKEIKLWFKPEELVEIIYPVKEIEIKNRKELIWA
ncbi:MAG: nucleoside-diphosphate kinase [Candidatus Pacearchaeota archaeon]